MFSSSIGWKIKTQAWDLCKRYTIMEYYDQLIKFSLIMLHEYPAFGILYIAASALFSLTAIFGNVIVIYALWISSSVNRTSKTLLLSLAASDLSVGLLVHPLNAAMMIQVLRLAASNDDANDDHNASQLLPLVKTNLFFSIFSGAASLFSVGAISIDRYLAMSMHLRYKELVTSRRVRIVVSAIWITSFTAALLQSLLYFSQVISTAGVVLVMAGASFSYFKIFRTVSYHQNQICVQGAPQNQICQLSPCARAMKLAKKTLYIFVIFAICYFPSLFIFPAFAMSKAPTSLLMLFYFSAAFLILFNSSLNPLVYCWKICEVRETVVDVLRRMFSGWIP